MKTLCRLSAFLFCCIGSTLNAAPMLAHPIYGELDLGFAQALSGGERNHQIIYLGPGTKYPLELISKNKAPSYGLHLSLGGGYEFPLCGPLSWSVGGRLSTMSVETKGKGVLAGNTKGYQYQYNARVMDLSTVARLYYRINSWRYYVGASLGLAQLSSGDYASSFSGIDRNGKQTKQAISYGVQGGAFYAVLDNLSLGAQMRYQNLGVAELGPKAIGDNTRKPAAPQGRIKQTLSFIQFGVQLSYHF